MTDNTCIALTEQMDAQRDILTLLRNHINGDIAEDHNPETCEVCSEYTSVEPEEAAAERYLDELPLEVVKEVGTPLAVVLTTGGPHIEIVKDSRGGSAYLEGYWSSEHITRHDEVFQWAIDYFIPED